MASEAPAAQLPLVEQLQLRHGDNSRRGPGEDAGFEDLNDAAGMASSQAASSLSSSSSGSEVADSVTRKRARRFAGLTYAQLGIAALILGAAIWAMWATAKIFALDDRRVVSVRLSGIVNDYVAAEARSGSSPEELGARTRAFMGALDLVLKQRASAGQVVLVGEAVIASSVPDVTNDVVRDLAKLVKMPVAQALPPLGPPLAPPGALPSAPSAAQAPSGLSPGSPFGDAPVGDAGAGAHSAEGSLLP